VGADFDPGRERAQTGPLQEADPVVERGVGAGLADEEEVKTVQSSRDSRGRLDPASAARIKTISAGPRVRPWMTSSRSTEPATMPGEP
jgi:hypothetical protein